MSRRLLRVSASVRRSRVSVNSWLSAAGSAFFYLIPAHLVIGEDARKTGVFRKGIRAGLGVHRGQACNHAQSHSQNFSYPLHWPPITPICACETTWL